MDTQTQAARRGSEPRLAGRRGPVTEELFDYLTGLARPSLLRGARVRSGLGETMMRNSPVLLL